MEKLNELYDQLKRIDASTKFIKVVNTSCCYPRHPNATEYGVVNFDYNRSPKRHRVYIVTKSVRINDILNGYAIELYNKGYLISYQGYKQSSYIEFLQQVLTDLQSFLAK